MTTGGLRGRWAQGLQPRDFTWVIKDRLGVGERPGDSRVTTARSGAKKS